VEVQADRHSENFDSSQRELLILALSGQAYLGTRGLVTLRPISEPNHHCSMAKFRLGGGSFVGLLEDVSGGEDFFVWTKPKTALIWLRRVLPPWN
jgi:hypothetical protein